MWMTVRECLEQAKKTDDSLELAAKLRALADDDGTTDEASYFMREAALNLEAHFRLTRAMAGRLAQAYSLGSAPAPLFAEAEGGAAALRKTTKPFTAARPRSNAGPVASGEFMALADVLATTTLGRSAWLERVTAGTAPKPVKLGRRSVWRAEEIRAWCAAQ